MGWGGGDKIYFFQTFNNLVSTVGGVRPILSVGKNQKKNHF